MKSSKSVFSGVILVILTVLIISVGCFFINFKNGEGIRINKGNKEEEFNNKNVINEINLKIEYLNYFVNISSIDSAKNDSFRKYGAIGFRNELLENKLDERLKLEIVLNSFAEKFNPLNSDIAKANINNNFKELAKGYENEVFTELNANELNDFYQDLFGEEIKEYYSYENHCPTYLYDDITNKYFKIQECGGASPKVYYSYKDKYTYKDDKVYIYVYYGVANYDNETDKYVLYKDVNEKVIYKDKIDNGDEIDAIFIDNHKNFTKYKYTFKKNNNGNYSFEMIEKA